MSMRHTQKEKKCKQCKNKFTPKFTLQLVCSLQCALAYTKEQKQKKEKSDWRKRKKTLKEKTRTISDERGELQKIFNEWVRERDRGLPCISCDTTDPNLQYHCGHFFSTGAFPAVRFHEDNGHRQCSVCNNHKHGNLLEYRPRLLVRIGEERFNHLDSIKNIPIHLTRDEIVDLKAKYREKIKLLKSIS